MRGVLDVCSRVGRVCYHGVVVVVHKRVRLIAVMLVLSLLIAALPASSGSARAAKAARTVSEESLPLQLYRSLRTTVAAIGMWMAENVRSTTVTTTASTYEPVSAYLSPEAPFIDAPTALTVTAAADASLSLSWTAPAGSVDHYQIERSQSISGPFLFRANSATTTFNDTSVSTDQAYLYRIRAVTSGGLPSTPSNMALGTATTFEFSGAALTGKLGKKQHIYDLRTAINAVRTVAGLSAATWTRSDLTGLLIVANDVQELRTRLGEALTMLDIPVGAYTDPTLTANVSVIKATHIDQLQARSTRGSSNSSGPIDPDSSTARLDPLNTTGGGGENPLSRNFNWKLPLVGLPGRAGLDLGLTLSYNSLVWTKIGNSVISFDDDRGFPAPGFRLGFPTIQSLFFNSETGKNAYLLIGPDGSRTELRATTDPTLYESSDSSHLLLDVSLLTDPVDPRMVLKSSDGSQLTYKFIGQAYACTEIKDRNGNYITINYNTSGLATGRIANIHDTLNRVITFNYDANGLLSSITQEWKRQPPNETQVITHTWASFTYEDLPIQTTFHSSLSVTGVVNNTAKVLTKVTLADNSQTVANNSHVDFSYTPFGQVWKISTFAADNQLLNHRAYKLPKSPLWTDAPIQDDCPRFTERRDWGQWANGDTNKAPTAGEEAVTIFSATSPASWTMPDQTQHAGVSVQVTEPDGTFQKIYYADTVAGVTKRWLRGLPELTENFDIGGTVALRRIFTTWEQDNETLSYELNPRVKESAIYDPALTHPKRTRISYQAFTPPTGSSYKLPRDFFEYDESAANVLRSTRKDYVDGDDAIKAPYLSRRILGLVKEHKVYQGDVTNGGVVMARVGFSYDESGSIQGSDAPVQHDNTNYASGFVTGRGNLSTVTRYNVEVSASTSSKMEYNTAGAVVSSKNALDKELKIDYTDSFSDGNNTRGTFAYPTTVTDPDNFYSTAKYNFDFGSVTYRQTPPPNATTQAVPSPTPVGPVRTFSYDDLGRLERTTSLVTNVYTRYQYPASKIRIETFSTLVAGKGEAKTFNILDGFGRTIASASDHPATTGTSSRFDAQRMAYDVMGRVIKTSNPAETSASGDDPAQWALVEGDAGSNWQNLYTQYTYDWKGRPLITTNTDGTTKSVTYGGCGCAGGEVVTANDEGTIVNGVTKTRQNKTYTDVLGRVVKTEVWNFDGTGPGGVGRAIYSTTVTTYNVRDQVTLIRQYKGAPPSNYLTDLSCETGTCQKTEVTYDGYGRQDSKHLPEQRQTPYAKTSWTYNADDTVNTKTDGRGAVSTYGYGTSGNNRRLVKTISHTLSGSLPIEVTFDYDAAGNRKSMSHFINGTEQDSCDYTYDELSRLTSETRHITALEGSATGGDYNIGYGYTLGSQVSSVTDPFGSTTNLNYDAIGRTESVTGEYAGVNRTYASDIEYRAWGAVKRHGVQTITYNNRMRPTQFRHFQYRYDYNYHPDGQLKHLTDLDDMVGSPSLVQFHYMSRDYGYDAAGRVVRVDGTDNPLVNGGIVPAPFVGNYGYDEFNNMVGRSGYYALNTSTTDSATFVDNKRTNTGWTYDADGRVLTSADTATNTSQTWSYDAAGSQIGISEVNAGATTTNTLNYDGNGKLLYESVTTTTPQSTKTNYLIHSTVLGTMLTKLDALGNKDITYVPTNGLTFSTQTKDFNGNPIVGGALRDVTGLQEDGKAVDPFGARVMNVQPPDSTEEQANMHVFGPPYSSFGWSTFTDANNFSSGCYSAQDNNRESCNNAMRRTMGDEFINYFFHRSQLTSAENDYIGRLNAGNDDPTNFNGVLWLPPDDSIPGRFGHFVPVFGHIGYASLVPADPQIQSGLIPTEGQKRWNNCMGKYLSEQYPEGKPKPTGDAVYFALYGGLNDIKDSAMLLALWAKESSFELRPKNDHGPLQLTSWWSNHSKANNLNLIVPGAYDSFGRPKGHPNRDRRFEGDIEANVMTAGNIIRYSRKTLGQSYGDIAYHYGPGPDKATRSAYEDHAMKLQPRYANFLNCLKTGE
jgi:YD repeat-containing protein